MSVRMHRTQKPLAETSNSFLLGIQSIQRFSLPSQEPEKRKSEGAEKAHRLTSSSNEICSKDGPGEQP
jgi:hypothetical protein